MSPNGAASPRRTRFIILDMLARDTAPSMRELMDAAGLVTPSAIHAQYDRLEEDGMIDCPRVGKRRKRAARAIRLTALGRAEWRRMKRRWNIRE